MKIIIKSNFERNCSTDKQYADAYNGYVGFELTNFNPSTELAGLDCDVVLWRSYRKCARFFIKDETSIMAVKLCLSNTTEYQRWFNGHKDKKFNIIRGDYDGALGCGEIVNLPKKKLKIPKYDRPFFAPDRASTPDSIFIRRKVLDYRGRFRTEYQEYDLDENLINTWGGISISNSNWSYL